MRHDGRRRVGTYSDEYWLIYERKRCVENCLMWEGIGGHFVREVLKCNIDTVVKPPAHGSSWFKFHMTNEMQIKFRFKNEKKSVLIACLPLLRVPNAIIRKGGPNWDNWNELKHNWVEMQPAAAAWLSPASTLKWILHLSVINWCKTFFFLLNAKVLLR